MTITQQELIDKMDKLHFILNQLLISRIKEDDAPASSETHLDMAIVSLYEIVKELEYDLVDPEMKEQLNTSIEHMNFYKKEKLNFV
jgi:hypothetical protein